MHETLYFQCYPFGCEAEWTHDHVVGMEFWTMDCPNCGKKARPFKREPYTNRYVEDAQF